MRVLLVAPTALDYEGNPIKQRRVHLPGLTLQMLAAVTPPDVELRLVGETTDTIPFDEPWDLVGLTGMGSGLVRAWQLADEFRRRGRKVVIGGIAASLCDPEWTLAHADALVLGEAEELWPQVLEDTRRGQLRKIYQAASPPDIETLPLPRYDLMTARQFGVWSPVQATRGCPFTCSFCSITSYFKQRYRKRPVSAVIRDVRAAKRIRKSRYVAFIDDNIGVDWDYCRELWTALIQEKIIWMSQCSLHIAEHPEMLALAYKSGCRFLSIGVETTNALSLATVDKSWNRPERYGDAFRVIRDHGIDISTEMMIGLDEDDESIFEEISDFVMREKISAPRFHVLTPIPGTPLYEELRSAGRIINDNLGWYSGGKVVFQPKQIDPVVLQQKYWELYDRTFSLGGIFRRIGRNRPYMEPYMRAFVIGVNMHYRKHVKQRICPGIV